MQELQSEFPSIKNFVTLSPVPGFSRWLAGRGRDTSKPLSDIAEEIATSPHDAETIDGQSDYLKQLCSEYLLKAKRGILPMDPVARFHLGNGALIHQIRTGADLSEKGLRQSRGLMVNYLYDTRYIERNHEQFMTEGKIHSSSELQKLAQKVKPAVKKSA